MICGKYFHVKFFYEFQLIITVKSYRSCWMLHWPPNNQFWYAFMYVQVGYKKHCQELFCVSVWQSNIVPNIFLIIWHCTYNGPMIQHFNCLWHVKQSDGLTVYVQLSNDWTVYHSKKRILRFNSFNITLKQGVYFTVHSLRSIRTKCQWELWGNY